MSKIANIIIDVDEDKAVAAVNKLANSFTKVDKNVQQSNEALQELRDQTKQIAKAYFGLEAAKKVFEIADAALTAAAAQEGLTGKTKDTAVAYVKLKDSVQDVATGMVLATANLASSIGGVLNLNGLLEDTAAAWREIAGLQQKSTEQMYKDNAYALQLSAVGNLALEYKTSAAELEKYKGKNEAFAQVARKSMIQLEGDIKIANDALEKYGKKLDENTLEALKLGKTTTDAIREGKWEKQAKKLNDLADASKRAREAEEARLNKYAEDIKKNFGTYMDIIDRQYVAEVRASTEAFKAKKVTLDQYNDALEKSLQKRNDLFYKYEKENDDRQLASAQSTNLDLAQEAYDLAQKEADIRFKYMQEQKTREDVYQRDLLALKQTYASTDEERIALEKQSVEMHYSDLSEKYRDSADMQVEIARAKEAEIQAIEAKTAEMRIAQMNGATDNFLFALSVMAKEDKKFAKGFKALAIAQAIANTAVGVTKAYAQGGALGFITGASVAAAGAAQIAVIKEQKFATGGIVEGNSNVGDKIPVSVNSGEMILNKSQQKNLFNTLNGNSSATSQPINISFNISGGTNSMDLRKILSENMPEFAMQIKKAVSSPYYTQTQSAI